jgi:hypothetical protein
MASFTLDIDEFAAMVGFLHAKKIVGMDERLFASFSEANLPNIMDKLQQHGWMKPADRPNTWHTNENLVETLAITVAPDFAILGRSKTQPKSILFYVADKLRVGAEEAESEQMSSQDFVQVVVTNDQVIVTNIADERALGACLAAFLDAAFPAEIVVARVRGETFDAGRVAVVDERGSIHTSIRGLGPDAEFPWNEATIPEFVHEAMGELVRA